MRKRVAQEQDEQAVRKRVSWKELLGIFQYILPYKATFAIGLVFLILSTSTTLVFPYLASMLADAAQGQSALNLNQLGLGLLAILVMQAVFSYFRIILFSIVSEKAMGDVRKSLYAKLIRLEIPFFEKRRVGELTSRIAADVSQLQSALSINLAEMLRQFFTLIIGIAIIAYTSLKLTLIMLSTFPVAIILTMFFGRYIRRLSRETQDLLGETNVVVEETLQSVQVVKAFTNEWYESQRYNNKMEEVVAKALKTARYRGLFVTFLISAVFGGITLVLWLGFGMVESKELTTGELISFLFYTVFIGASISGVGNLYSEFQKAIGASDRIREILDEQEEVAMERPVKKELIQGDIQYQQVSFRYPTRTDIEVLKGVTLDIKQGQKIALVGHSGSGKSTIVQLLMRMYQLENGAILVGGKAIDQYNISQLRANIGIVPQEVLLFGGTIRENILYGNPDATEADLVSAARKANALSFIESFPEGFDTLVGERGIKLSGGQKQRVAIARAILKDPAILILDEATSSLDAESEKLVQGALNELMEGRTTIIIAHRLSTIREVDCIYVLDNGQIVEQGTHTTLANKEGGVYQHLLRLQFAEV